MIELNKSSRKIKTDKRGWWCLMDYEKRWSPYRTSQC